MGVQIVCQQQDRSCISLENKSIKFQSVKL